MPHGAQVGRLLYRAKQRGFLEMDLLVGLWAQANLPRMDAAHLAAFEVRACGMPAHATQTCSVMLPDAAQDRDQAPLLDLGTA